MNATAAVRHSAADPRELPHWSRLAGGHSFYVSPDWLAYADRVGSPGRYHVAAGPVGAAALSAHCVTGESAEYDPRPALGGRPGPGPVLTLGGRRGFRSGLLVDDAGDALLPGLVRTALDAEPAAQDRWWWPYLTLDEALRAGSALRAAGTPVELHHLGADCLIDLAGAGPQDHLATLPLRQRRTNVRREMRRFADSGLWLEPVTLADHAQTLIPLLAPLLGQVQHKYGHDQSVDELAGLLQAQAERLGRYALTLLCRDGERIVGFSLCYRWGEELAVRIVGFDYQALTGADEYAQLVVHGPLAHGYAAGLRRLHLGIDSWEAKCRRGARLRSLWALAAPGLAAGPPLRRLDALADELPRHEADRVRAEVRAGLDRAAAAGLAEPPPSPDSHPDYLTGQS